MSHSAYAEPPRSDDGSSTASPLARAATWLVPPVIVLLFVWLAFGGPHWDARVPVAYSGDALFYLAQSKTTIDHGWWWYNPSISAPFGYPALLFAQNTNVAAVPMSGKYFFARSGPIMPLARS